VAKQKDELLASSKKVESLAAVTAERDELLATVAKQKDELLSARKKITSLETKQKIVSIAAKQKDAPPALKQRDVPPPVTRQKGEPISAKQNVELLGALKELQESLRYANENPACGINGTIWMLRGNKTLFDFIDETIVTAERIKRL